MHMDDVTLSLINKVLKTSCVHEGGLCLDLGSLGVRVGYRDRKERQMALRGQ